MSTRTPVLNGLRYDAGAYACDLKQSVGPGHYVLATPVPHCDECLPGDPRIQTGIGLGGSTCRAGGGGVSWIDVESDLHNLPRRATRASCADGGSGGAGSHQHQPTMGPYHPEQGRRLASACGAGAVLQDCKSLPVEDTRMANPPCTLRGTGWNRWEWLCQDPQANALLPFDVGVDTSLVAKDNHRPALPCPISAAAVLPPARHDAAAMATDAPPAWAQEILSRHAQRGARVGDGVGADGATPMLSFRDCPEVHALNARVPA